MSGRGVYRTAVDAVRPSFAAGLGVMLLAACHTHPAPRGVPAVLTHPTAQARAELARVVSEALHGAPVTLADDTFARDGTLVVERTLRRDAQGRPLDGRETGRPDHFRLVQDGTRCVLVHEETSRHWTLQSATCAPR